ncbi:MBL fold metallo-hydrolase [Fusibacter bizertensis]|uniref:MBL fold metallo-hydrolase n=1 Tax=Fusibacter bizertensis TaxID=1488331 RepID=A0ABT6NAQ9_9FIRM|nr:MBL fold metallo-hydrolase [Fusibacter bizertensis]MDH8677496.1 MBL fold metallo-hydrolase [Fusibacter bizertensis]
MKIKQVGTRNFIFTYYDSEDWDLNLQLIIGEKYNYIIDPGIGAHTLNPMINFASVRNQNPFIIINTHYHWDHIWANCLVKEATIISHRSCIEAITRDWERSIQKNKVYLKDPVEMRLPSLVFEERLEFFEDRIILFHTPGHTYDSISVYDQAEQVLNVGDNIGDTPELIIPELECNVDIYRDSVLKYKALNPKMIISGHNQPMKSEVLDRILGELATNSSS